MDIDAGDLLPLLQQQLGALMVENMALRAQIQKLEQSQQGTEEDE